MLGGQINTADLTPDQRSPGGAESVSLRLSLAESERARLALVGELQRAQAEITELKRAREGQEQSEERIRRAENALAQERTQRQIAERKASDLAKAAELGEEVKSLRAQLETASKAQMEREAAWSLQAQKHDHSLMEARQELEAARREIADLKARGGKKR